MQSQTAYLVARKQKRKGQGPLIFKGILNYLKTFHQRLSLTRRLFTSSHSCLEHFMVPEAGYPSLTQVMKG